VLTLSTSTGYNSWTAHCFYAYLPEQHALVFTSDPETRHGQALTHQAGVSGGIVLETRLVGKIQGIQLTGHVLECQSLENQSTPIGITPEKARSVYIKKFPYAIATQLHLWVLVIDYLKMTDNRLGFGKKLEWKREDHL